GGVVEDPGHPRELFLQARLAGTRCVAPGGFDLALALLPALAGGAVGDARAQVVFHLAGLAAGAVGVAGKAGGLERDAARLGVRVFAEVAVVVPGAALVLGRRRQALGVRELRGRRRLRAPGVLWVGLGFGPGLGPGDCGDDRRRRFVARDHHGRLDDLDFLPAA